MLAVFRSSWPLFIGLLLLMAGNALQGAALGLRAINESISNETFGYISAAYFAGFLAGSQFTPHLLMRVGHIRVFAALGSLISVAFLLYIYYVDPIFWFLMRIVVGFGYAGVYIVAESWINSLSTNETRGQTLATYMFIQYSGVVVGQQLLNIGDPNSFELFILMSALVSISFAPILLSVTPAPVYQTGKPMGFRDLFKASPLGAVGSIFMGGLFGAMFGMGAIYGGLFGLNVSEIALLLTSLYLGGVIFQMPIGWISDRVERRFLIVVLTGLACLLCMLAMWFGEFELFRVGDIRVFSLYFFAFAYGSLANPTYGVLLAHTNDFLKNEEMAAASGRFVFLYGLGALGGPIICGYLMGRGNPAGFWAFQAACAGMIAIYGIYRATQRAAVPAAENNPYTPASQTWSPVAAEMAQEIYIEKAEAVAEKAAQETDGNTDERRSRETMDDDER
jgi:MFS family permease